MAEFVPGIYEYKGKQYLAQRLVYGAGYLKGEQLVYYVPTYPCDLPCFVRFKDEFLDKFTFIKAFPDDPALRH